MSGHDPNHERQWLLAISLSHWLNWLPMASLRKLIIFYNLQAYVCILIFWLSEFLLQFLRGRCKTLLWLSARSIFKLLMSINFLSWRWNEGKLMLLTWTFTICVSRLKDPIPESFTFLTGIPVSSGHQLLQIGLCNWNCVQMFCPLLSEPQVQAFPMKEKRLRTFYLVSCAVEVDADKNY